MHRYFHQRLLMLKIEDVILMTKSAHQIKGLRGPVLRVSKRGEVW